MSCCICRIWVSKYIFHFWHPMHPTSPQHLSWNIGTKPLNLVYVICLRISIRDIFMCLSWRKYISNPPKLDYDESRVFSFFGGFPPLECQESVGKADPKNKQKTTHWYLRHRLLHFCLHSWPQSTIIRNSLENLDCSLRPSQSASIIQRINREMELKTFLCPLSLAR